MDQFARTRTVHSTFKGVQGRIKLPMSWSLPDPYEYIAFYLGCADLVEGGVSWGKADSLWHFFLNCGQGNFTNSLPFDPQPAPGEVIHLKLVNDGDGYVSFYINGVLIWAEPMPQISRETHYYSRRPM